MSSLLQAIIIDEIFKTYGCRRFENKWLYFGVGILYAIINSIIGSFVPIQIVFVICGMILLVIFSLMYKIYFWKRALFLMLLCVLFVIIEMLTGLIMCAVYNQNIEDIQTNIGLYILAAVSSKIVLLGHLKIINHFTNNKIVKLYWQTIVMLLIMPISSFFVLSVLSYFVFNINDKMYVLMVIFSETMLLFSNLIVFFVFDFLEKQKLKELEISQQAMQLEMEKQYYCDLTQKYKNSNKTYHDLKHKLYAIDKLLDSDLNLAKSEIKNVCSIVESAKSICYTNNDSIDSLLNAKINSAKDKGIAVKITSILSDFTDYNVMDICVLLGNIFDNAIKATKVNECINLILKQSLNHLIIKMSNPINDSKIIAKNERNNFVHGYGLKSVQEITQNYNGFFQNKVEDGHFIISILLWYKFMKAEGTHSVFFCKHKK